MVVLQLQYGELNKTTIEVHITAHIIIIVFKDFHHHHHHRHHFFAQIVNTQETVQ